MRLLNTTYVVDRGRSRCKAENFTGHDVTALSRAPSVEMSLRTTAVDKNMFLKVTEQKNRTLRKPGIHLPCL